ncbi:MAG: hypothetical protein MI864_09320 [Pseudomonadales bacterium]|nr:hypothetical protein [Pseudomonadales bacterium]
MVSEKDQKHTIIRLTGSSDFDAFKSAFEAWYSKNTASDSTDTNYFVLLRSQNADLDSGGAASITIWVSLLRAQLQHEIAAAEELGLELTIKREVQGIGFYFSGPADVIEALQTKVFEQVLSVQINFDAVEIYRNGWINYLQGTADFDPLVIADDLLLSVLHVPGYRFDELNRAMELISCTRIENAVQQFLSCFEVLSLACGDLEPEQAKHWSIALKSQLVLQGRELKSSVKHRKINRLPVGTSRMSAQTTHDDSVNYLYLQGVSNTPEEIAHFILLSRIIDSKFYTALRTEQQLGYLIQTGYREFLGHPGLVLRVQSPVAGPEQLEMKAAQFLEEFAASLKTMQDVQFNDFLAALIEQYTDPYPTLSDQADGAWRAIRSGVAPDFMPDLILSAARGINRQNFIAWALSRLDQVQSQRLSLLIEGDEHKIETDWRKKHESSFISAAPNLWESAAGD